MEVSTRDKISEQLTLILSSPRFSGSTVLSEFLDFIVKEALEGRGNVLKEYTIGVHALGKDPDFNPQLDSIVRIHAGRLRRALKEYYYEEGVHDPIVIAIPKGSYMPVFQVKSTESHDPEINVRSYHEERDVPSAHESINGTQKNGHRKKSSDYKPAVAILPFRRIGNGDTLDHFSQSIGEFLCTELTRFENLKVISYYSADHITTQSRQLKEIGNLLDADYILTATVEEAYEHLRVFVQFNCCESGEQLWGRTFEKPEETKSYWNFQSDVVELILASITGMNGVISRHELKKNGLASTTSGKTSLGYWYNKYSHNPDKNTLQEAKQFYQQIIKEDSENALAMAYLSCILNTEMCLKGYTTENGNTSLNYAHAALRLDPHCQHAYQALAFNMLILRKGDECVRTLEEGLTLNPKSVEYRGAMGAFLIYAGSFEKGAEMLDHVTKLTPILPWWQTMGYTCHAFYKGNYADVLFWADRVKVNFVWIPILKAASYAELNDKDNVNKTLKQFTDQFPDISLSDKGVLNKIFFTDKLAGKLDSGISKALSQSTAR